MSVYYKFRHSKEMQHVPIEDNFISVALLKQRIFQSKKFWWREHLTVANAQTMEELDEKTLIPQCTSLIVCRLHGPRWSHMPLVVDRRRPKVAENNMEHEQPAHEQPAKAEEIDWHDFGDDVFASNVVRNTPSDKADEFSKTKASIASSSLDSQTQSQDSYIARRGFGRDMAGRMTVGRGFGLGGFELKKPSQGYICFRCNVPGHFIQHCPTNGDPDYDIKRTKHPIGAVVASKSNEEEGLSSTRSVVELPPEFHCSLCKEVMKDAMMSKCCFDSFCDACIRDHIMSKSMCVCGATNILVDGLLPNKTIRDAINRILESNNTSTQNSGSTLEIQGMESALISATSKGGRVPPSPKKYTADLKEAADSGKPKANSSQQSLEKGRTDRTDRTDRTSDLSEATLESMRSKESKLLGSGLRAEKEVQQKHPTCEPAAELNRSTPQDFFAENRTSPFVHPTCDPYWGGMPLVMDGYMVFPYSVATPQVGYPPALFGKRKTDNKRKHENDQPQERECYKDRDCDRELSKNVAVSSMKSKSRILSKETKHTDPAKRTHSRDRLAREAGSIRHGRKREDRHEEETNKHKVIVSSRISSPEGGINKKRKLSFKEIDDCKDLNPSNSSAHCRQMSDHNVNNRGETSVLSERGRKRMAKTVTSDDDEEMHFERRPITHERRSVDCI